MNVLLATTCATPKGGGIASYNQELQRLFSRVHNMYLITHSDEYNVEGYIETLSIFGKNRYSYEFSQYILSKIEDWQIDIIINSASDFLAIIAPFVKIPIISVSHFVNGKLALIAGYNGEFLNSVISLSNYGKDYLKKNFINGGDDKIKVVYNFVSNKEDDYLYKNKIRKETVTIVYPGGTSVKKSFEVVLLTLYKLLKTNLDFRFIWLGANNLPLSFLSSHKDLKQYLNTDSRLCITGNISREDAIHILEDANIFLLPSRGEGCPMTLLEAMRAGCVPIVSDALHASREILTDGGFGKIVKQGSSKALYEVLKTVIENHTDYTEDYEKTYNYLRSALSQTRWNEQMTNILNDVVHQEKKYINMTHHSFLKSLNKYKRKYRWERFKEQLASLIVRIKLEWIYYVIKE